MTIRAPIFDAIRDARGRGWQSGDPEIAAIDQFLTGIGVPSASAPSPALPLIKVGLTDEDFQWAAQELGCQVAQIRAVDEVESGGGWFTDMRAEILAIDGPGGFVDGQELPKILFEAHKFDAFTGGRFRASHPNISSKGWNRALYAGGQAEYVRLHRAMELDREAALKSASVGRYQIMGFNHAAAGFDDVEAFWSAMKSSERAHLEAFVAFIRSSHLVGALRRISIFHADCVPFAKGYNGSAFASHDYHKKIARAFKKWSMM
ncbi:MAG: N-acetylmuramidase family protein [Erythrobacter sp.]|nr:N-acetylmuramidase family protein [Erythrobacter sp.]